MTEKDIFTGLLLIQDKHATYFSAQQASVIDYLAIDWQSKPVKVRLINQAIPPELKADFLSFLPNVQSAE